MSIKTCIEKVNCIKYQMLVSNNTYEHFMGITHIVTEYFIPSLGIVFKKINASNSSNIMIYVYNTKKPINVIGRKVMVSEEVSFSKEFIDNILLANKHMHNYIYHHSSLSNSWNQIEELK